MIPMPGKLNQQVAVITGGASGIGAGIARRFAQEGARIVIADRDRATGEQLATELSSSSFVEMDVTQAESVAQGIQSVIDRYGQVDILVNNAGIDGEQAPTADCSLENWNAVRSTNLDGVFYGMKTALKTMELQGSGVILNLASVCGIRGVRKLPAYAAAKAGVIHLTKATALEYAPKGIRVNALCPSVVHTSLLEHFITHCEDPEATRQRMDNFNPMPGMVTVEAVASAALFLCSDEAQFITGVDLPIDGGYTI